MAKHEGDSFSMRLAQVCSHIVHPTSTHVPLRTVSRADTLGLKRSSPSAADALVARGFEPIGNDVVEKALCELDEQGYTILADMIERGHLEQLRQHFELLSATEGRLGGIEVLPSQRQKALLADPAAEGPNPGIRRLGDLVNKGACFDKIWQNEVLLSIVAGVLPGPFKLHSLNGHDPKPGYGHQALHADWAGPQSTAEVVAAGVWTEDSSQIERPAHLFGVVNSAWCLDDFTKANGATRIVPGSHQVPGSKPTEEATSRAVYAIAKAGSVIVWNGSTWHGGSVNTNANGKRRAIHCAWIDRNYPQQTNQRKYLRQETTMRFQTSLQSYLLDTM